MVSIESLRVKFRNKVYIPLTCKERGRTLKNADFTIISNNCWGGTVYEAYHLQKQSPTVGMFFMAEDYIAFLSDLKKYIYSDLTFIRPEESRWRDVPLVAEDKRFRSYPIGVLSNGEKTIELFFLHYRTEQEAREKWERRVKRINWDKMLIKFNDQNGCTEKNLADFCRLPFKNKIFFTCREWETKDQAIVRIAQPIQTNSILGSYEPFERTKVVNITEILNSL